MIRRLSILAALPASMLMADELSLVGEAKLSGIVKSIGENGSVELQSPLSPEPLMLKAASVSKITFNQREEQKPKLTSQIELTNGDQISGKILSMNDSSLVVESLMMGHLEIRRDALRTLQLGVGGNRPIYPEIKSLKDWEVNEGADVWELDGKTLIMSGSGSMGRKFDLPPQFLIRFQLDWNTIPAFRLAFAGPRTDEGEEADFYSFHFGSAGIEIRRNTEDGEPPVTLGYLNRPPQIYSRKSVKVELRVDRDHGVIQLMLDGEPEGRFIDVKGAAPSGGSVMIEANGSGELSQQIRQFEIVEWSPLQDRYRTRERGDKSRDALVTRDGERWNGVLQAVRAGPNGPVFVFKGDSADQPLELDGSAISTLFFADHVPTKAPKDANPFVLRLNGDGALRVSSCAFDESSARVMHPLLGMMTIPRDRIASLEWVGGKSAPKKGGKP